jgi:hypothetical protein
MDMPDYPVAGRRFRVTYAPVGFTGAYGSMYRDEILIGAVASLTAWPASVGLGTAPIPTLYFNRRVGDTNCVPFAFVEPDDDPEYEARHEAAIVSLISALLLQESER